MTKQLSFLSNLQEVEEVEILKINIRIEDGKYKEFVVGSIRNGKVNIPKIMYKLLARKVVKGKALVRFGLLNINLPLKDYNVLLEEMYNEVLWLC